MYRSNYWETTLFFNISKTKNERQQIRIIFLLLIFLQFIPFTSVAEKVQIGTEPLSPEEAFVVDHIIVGPSEAVIRWQIHKFYYLYKEKFSFSSNDFIIEKVHLPPPEVIVDPFFGASEIYQNLVEATLHIIPINKGKSNGILDISFQGCWEGGVCYPPVNKTIELSGF